ncbi:helix-turn-helix domain-containing protein [Vagococcus vulneris]|uniref:Mga helix-turn-helix domain-containing protein n=1 Tax=Vagococcus vulneris TaxID=1977869 RepID=A0A430A096_9ENTE|nr:helix-turn-helix domain-containing protein [Vagococcus vulneris]RST99760.1 hypothetical protein CBF37_03275 [Vagococcus vulneris]
MKYDDLLERKEAKQLLLLKKLIFAGGKMRFNDMHVCLNVSKASLETYVSELMLQLTRYQKKITLEYDGEWLAVMLVPKFSLKQVERDFYTEAIRYKILIYLFYHPEFSTVHLAEELGLSESTLFRKIKELNNYLEEFGMMIWQGRLTGEEHQIRYFYFQLIWCIDHNFKEITCDNPHDFICLLEEKLVTSLCKESVERLHVWLTVCNQRALCKNKRYCQLRKLFKPFEMDLMYLNIRQLLKDYTAQNALILDDEEAMMQFIFIISMSILSEEDVENYISIRSKYTPTALTDKVILDSILQYYAPLTLSKDAQNKMFYHLFQNHPRLYFFKGDIEIHSTSHLWELEESLSSHSIKKLSNFLLQTAKRHLVKDSSVCTSLDQLTELKYLSILMLVDRQINRNVNIAVDLNMTSLFKEMTIQMIKLQLDSLNGVTCQVYQADTEYDLVITNEQDYEYSNSYYVLSELGTSYDIKQLKQLIRKIYSEKYISILTTIYE